jgi:DNA-binding transcriptional LysR family regulator
MQNRRIMDSIFHAAGAQIRAVVETNSLVTLWSHIRYGQWSTVVPHTFLLLLQRQSDVIALPLIEPDASHVLGMVISDRDPVSPLARELLSVASQFDMPSQIEQQIVQSWPATVWERRP